MSESANPPQRQADMSCDRNQTLGHLNERGHANNFNLIRLLAALTVIVSHSFALTGVAEPRIGQTGLMVSSVALDAFFLTSGYLVTKSLLLRQGLFDFIAARVLRIYPGLIVMTLVTVVVAGAVIGPGFFNDPATIRYALATGLISVRKLALFHLPGVFEANPFPRAVNGSLWTLPFELRMYAMLALLWLLASLMGRSRHRWMSGAVVVVAGAAALAKMATTGSSNVAFGFMFFGGAAFYVLRHHVPMRPRIAWSAAAVLLASSSWPPLFAWTYPLLVGYLLLSLSYLPRLWVPRSDYSYGAYIYAFPIQQSIALLLPGITASAMTGLAIPVTLVAAAASWHLIEKPSLALKNRLARGRSRLSVV